MRMFRDEHVRDEPVRELRLLVQRADHLAFLDPQNRRRHDGRGGAHAQRLSRQAPLAEEVARAEDGHHRLLPCRGQHGELHAAILEIEHAVCLRPLSEHGRAAAEADDAARHAGRLQERVNVERCRCRSDRFWRETASQACRQIIARLEGGAPLNLRARDPLHIPWVLESRAAVPRRFDARMCTIAQTRRWGADRIDQHDGTGV